MIRRVVLFCILIFLVGCKGEAPLQGVPIFDFSVDFDNYKSLDESNYHLSYEILPLELTNGSYMSFIKRVAMNDQYIYTISDDLNVNIFKRNGKHIKNIPKGRAANELLSPRDVVLDDRTGNVMFLDVLNQIKMYGPLGNYLSTQKLDFLSTEMNKIGGKYVFYNGNMSLQDSNFVILNGDKKSYCSVKRGTNIKVHGTLPLHSTKYKGDLYFMAEHDNILYKMGENDDEPIEYAMFNNVFADKSVKNRDYLALEEEYKGRKFMSIDPIAILNDELIYGDIGNGRSFLYDKITNTPYKHPFVGLFQVLTVLGVYQSQTIHCIMHENINKHRKDFPIVEEQGQRLYNEILAWERKNEISDNPYLIIVSYDKKK